MDMPLRAARLTGGFSSLTVVLAAAVISALAIETAVLSGIVADSGGAPLAGARVTISGNGVASMATFTRADGHYRFPALRPFTEYAIGASAGGFREITYEGMTLEAGRTRVVDFRLKKPDELDVVVLATRDPFPYEALVRAFSSRVEAPVRVIDLDAEADPAEAVRHVAAEKPSLILGAGLRAARLIRREVRDVPSILTLIDDPRRYDLSAPNLCFLANNPDASLLLRMLAAFLPKARRVGFVYEAETSSLLARDIREAAGMLGLTIELRPSYRVESLNETLDTLKGRIDALLVLFDPLTATPRALDRITAWAARNRVPLIAPGPEWARLGALVSYGTPPVRLGEDASGIASEILARTRQPSDLGLLAPGRPLLAINQETAAALGVPIPRDLSVDEAY